jgi:hypothetical protein
MKRISKAFGLLLITILTVFVSCDDFMDVHKKYVEDGEQFYAPKPDSIIFSSGNGRVQFICMLRNSPNVRKVNVYWNNKQNSLIIPVTPSSGLDTISTFIDLPEGAYTFTVSATDIYGHRSLDITGFASSYGASFASTLATRYINNMDITGSGAKIYWMNPTDELIRNEVRYRTKDGEIVEKTALPGESTTDCPNAEKTPYFCEYRSVFKIEQSVDLFYGEWVQSSFPATSVFLTGNASSVGFNLSTMIEKPFDETNPGVYVWELPLTSIGGELKFLTLHDWNGTTFRPMVANGSINDPEMQVYTGGADLKWKVQPGEDGNYRITLNVNTMTILFEKL